jgi:hypothetical protein
VIPFAWLAQGLRLVDIADPFAPRELGHFLPDPADGEDRPLPTMSRPTIADWSTSSIGFEASTSLKPAHSAEDRSS